MKTVRPISRLGAALTAWSLLTFGCSYGDAAPTDRLQGHVNQVVAHPSDSETIYAATPRGFYRSTDGGRNWTATWQEVYPTGRAADVLAVGVGRRDPSAVYISTDEGVLRSEDSGRTWRSANRGLGDLDVTGFALEESKPSVSYAATGRFYGSGIYKTIDRGRTWRPAGLQGLYVDAITIDPRRSILYAASSDPQFANDPVSVIAKSADGGRTWSGPRPGLTTRYVAALVSDHQGSSLFAATTRGLFSSADGGMHWQLRHAGVTTVAVGSQRLAEVFVATGRSILRSKNGGRSWSQFASASSEVSSLAVSANGDRLYAGTLQGVLAYELPQRRSAS